MAQVSKKTIKVGRRLIDLSTPKVMGILNMTPDSFHAESRMSSVGEVVDKAGMMKDQGATFIDIGGYSTRPGAKEVSVDEELERILSVIEPLTKQIPDLIISVDTFRSNVGEAAVKAGAGIINDVGGGTLDTEMLDTVIRLKVPYILMHMRGTPETMSSMTEYRNLSLDIINELLPKVKYLREGGVSDIIIDPGFGFAKTTEQNFLLMRHLTDFTSLDCPLLVGVSRKGMIYKTLEGTASEALNGTTVLNTLALDRGAQILRVHDVKEAAEAVKLWLATSGVY